jgi:UDP-N-acetylmuramoylalanine--D-glutamate ligase
MGPRALVYGLAVAGAATARALVQRGYTVIAADDRPTESGVALARELGIDLYEAPPPAKLARLVERCDLVAPSPGVPETHPLVEAAARAGVALRTEIDLAFEWEQARPGGPRPMVGITGTDGKTTTTLLARAMVEASGRRAIDAGNTDTPLVAALDLDVDVFVVECTSFRLAYTQAFAPRSATWLNLAPDHLDWHRSLATYIAAKAQIFAHQRPDDAAIGFASDPVVTTELRRARARHVTFAATGADYRRDGDHLVGPAGHIAAVSSMWRALPHDVTNALAAAATVLEAGVATPDGVAEALASFRGVPHRIALIAERDGVRWFDDSKATTPHAAVTAMRAFERVVLVAGGRNKGLDLATMAAARDHVVGVVAIGEAAPSIAAAFAGHCPVTEVTTGMDDAVAAARRLAGGGDVVLLSPGCASFDWYTGYGARGDDFARAVREQLERGGTR